MSRHYEKNIARAQQVVASVGQPPERTERRTRAEIESFVKGFGLSAVATKRLVDEWSADAKRAYDAGWMDYDEYSDVPPYYYG